MILAGTYRLPVSRQEFRYRHFWEWTTLAENQWTHDGRKLTPLMALAKLNLLHLLKALYGRVYFARSVYDETVVEGMRQGYEDARR